MRFSMDPSRALGGLGALGHWTSHLIPPGRQGRIGEAVTSFALKLFLGPFLPMSFSTSSRSSDRRQRCNRAQNSRNSALGRNRREMGPFCALAELTPRNCSEPCRLRPSVHVQHGAWRRRESCFVADEAQLRGLTCPACRRNNHQPAHSMFKELLAAGLCVTFGADIYEYFFEKAS